jgi:hypothetical protein
VAKRVEVAQGRDETLPVLHAMQRTTDAEGGLAQAVEAVTAKLTVQQAIHVALQAM